jgi:DNA adenine methylase
VLLNRDPSESEVYNDLSGSVVNFFKVLRSQRDELLEQLRLTLYSRQDFNECEAFIKDTPEEELRSRPVEWARCFFVGIRQSYMANREDWIASGVESGRVNAWWGGIKSLELTYNRLKRVQIENQDGLVLIKRFNTKDVLQYQDPPYLLSTRNEQHVYECEMTEEQHVQLADWNLHAECKIALSGYKSKLYTELYEENDWIRVDANYTIGGIGDKAKRTESLWCNYDPYSVRQGNQTALDEFFEVFR